jgi:uncharacterized protein (TIGR02145 family)
MKHTLFLFIVWISTTVISHDCLSQKKYNFDKVIFDIDSIAFDKKGNKISGLIEKKTPQGTELGHYLNGKKNGLYEYITPYKVVIKSETYLDNVLNGPYKLNNKSGQLIESKTYTSGFLMGERNFYKAQKLIETQNYLNGKLHGKWVKWNDERTDVLIEGEFVNGFRNGDFTEKYPGQILNKRVYHYEMGKLKSTIAYTNNLLSSSRFYNNEMLEGPILYCEEKNIKNEFPCSSFYMFENKYLGSVTRNEQGRLDKISVNKEFERVNGKLKFFTNDGEMMWEITPNGLKISKIDLWQGGELIGSCQMQDGKGKMKIISNNEEESIEISEGKSTFGAQFINEYIFLWKYNNGNVKEKFLLVDNSIENVEKGFENGKNKLLTSGDSTSSWHENNKLRYILKETIVPETSYYRSFHYYNESGSHNIHLDDERAGYYEGRKTTLKLFSSNDTITCFLDSRENKVPDAVYSPPFEKTILLNEKINCLSFSKGVLIVSQFNDSSDFSEHTGRIFEYNLDYHIDIVEQNSSIPCLLPQKYKRIVKGIQDGFYFDEFEMGMFFNGLKNGQWIVKSEKSQELKSIDSLFARNDMGEHFSILSTDYSLITYKNGKIVKVESTFTHEGLAKTFFTVEFINDSIVYSQIRENQLESSVYYFFKNSLIKEIHNTESNKREVLYNRDLNEKVKKDYLPNGKLYSNVTYKNGKIVASKVYNEKGDESPTVQIGNQIWTAQNFDLTVDRYGRNIPQAMTQHEWEKAFENKNPAWCYYLNQTTNGEKYGKLYNWYAILYLAPEGWHVPNEEEWNTLDKYSGSKSISAEKIKDPTFFDVKNSTNGFNARPGGNRSSYGTFDQPVYWWSTTEEEGNGAYAMKLFLKTNVITTENLLKGDGCYVRFVKDK